MQKFTLINEAVRQRCLSFVAAAPLGSLVTVRDEEGRNSDMNAKYHAMLTDISEQLVWHGMKLSVVVWKRLTTAAYLRELGESPMLVPSLDGHGLEIIYEKTSEMGKKVFSGLIEWTYAFGSSNGVQWSERVAAP